MADLDRNYAQGRTLGRADTGVIDQGLRAYMIRVYNYMAVGVAITGLVAYLTYSFAVQETAGGIELTSFGNFIFASAFKWVVIFAPLGMVFFLSARLNSMSVGAAQLAFWVFAGLMGLSLGSIFLVYAHASIARVFFISAPIVRRAEPLRLHHEQGPLRLGLIPVHGPDRHHPRLAG